jgi:hypothetical protein
VVRAGCAKIIGAGDDVFSENLRTNEVLVGSKRRMHVRLTGFPGLTTNVEGKFSVDDKVVTLLVRPERIPAYTGRLT